jgi:hypothetical protein
MYDQKKKKKNIFIICSLDGFANSIRPLEIKKFLEKKNYKVKLLNFYNFTESSSFSFLFKILNNYSPEIIKKFLIVRRLKVMRDRAKRIEIYVKKENPDAIICENAEDSYILTKDLNCLKIYDSPAPWVDELYYSGKLSKYIFHLLRKMELETYRKSDYVAFHWESMTRYVQENIYNGDNFFILNWGCDHNKKLAKFNKKPKIVFMGNLGGYWCNLPLLSKLSKMHEIDVYGGPDPPKEYGLNYKGYAPTTDILADYQFGLITISKDQLRRHGFSAKHLEYISYGLPVLTPDWRKDPRLAPVSIAYNEENFLTQIIKYSEEENWKRMSKKCYAQALKWRWENSLIPLLALLEKHLNNHISFAVRRV